MDNEVTKKIDEKMKETMEFAKDVAGAMYYMGNHEFTGSFPIDGKRVVLSATLTVEQGE
jgi:hypothetical protein